MLVAWFSPCAQTFTINGINYTTTSANTVAVAAGGSYTGNITIPSTVTYNAADYAVTSIADNAFRNCFDLESIKLPGSVISIGNYSFYSAALKSIILLDSMISIGNYAFYLAGLTSVTLPTSLTSIGDYAFARCTGLTTITVPNSVTSIGKYAFGRCYGLASIKLPESLTSISSGLFYWADGLKSITLPATLTAIGDDAFNGCTGLTEMKVNSTVPPTTGSGVFYNVDKSIPLYVKTSSLDLYRNAETWKDFTKIIGSDFTIDGINYKITSPNTVEVFGGSQSGAITIPAKVTSAGVTYSVTSIGAGAFYHRGYISVILPNSVTTIGDVAFARSMLTSIILSESLTSIGDAAFYFTELKSLTLPNSLTSIGKGAFEYCFGLKELKIYSISPPVMVPGSFVYSISSSIPLHVPAESVDLYRNADEWKHFTTIIGNPSTAITNPEATNYSLCISNRNIRLINVSGKTISVYDIYGRKISERTNSTYTEEFSIGKPGIFIISIENFRTKVIVY